jgi:hypothetical protein
METRGRVRLWRCACNARKVVIPAWLTELSKKSLKDGKKVKEISFESGSQMRELEFSAFSCCLSLKSICISASIEVIRLFSTDTPCPFSGPKSGRTPVEKITFEPGSRLREIAGHSFCNFPSLKSICLPASVEFMDGSSFIYSSLEEICVESGNPFFGVKGGFVVDFAGVRIVRYFGCGIDVTIPNEIETLGSYSFSSRNISTIQFDAMSNVSMIESHTFEFCGQLQSICIPSLVTILGERCFYNCDLLQIVTFEPESQLITLGDSTFMQCPALKSIVLPSRLKIIGKCCFFKCKQLETVTFTNDSKLVRIEAWAFASCRRLRCLSLPPLLEFVGENCFDDSLSFSTLTFSSPSQLRELLDVPRQWSDFNVIPDSVEVVCLCESSQARHFCTLAFGEESRLGRLRMLKTKAASEKHPLTGLVQSSVGRFRYFARISSRSLKTFRSNLEFEGL